MGDNVIRVEVDPDLCQGSDCCTRAVPGVFALGAEGVALLWDGDQWVSHAVAVPSVMVEPVLDAAAECPAGAITVLE